MVRRHADQSGTTRDNKVGSRNHMKFNILQNSISNIAHTVLQFIKIQ